MHRAVENDLMLCGELLRWGHQLRLHAHDLKIVRANPGAALQFQRIKLIAHHKLTEAAGPVVALAEIHEPGCLSLPLAQTFTGNLKVIAHVRMKDERQAHETSGHDAVRDVNQ